MPVTGMPIASAARDRHPAQLGVHLGGDVVNRAALVQVRGAAHPQPLTLG